PTGHHEAEDQPLFSIKDRVMRRLLMVTGFVGLVVAGWQTPAIPGPFPTVPVSKPYGLEKRVPWTTSKVVGSPEPPPPYKTEPAFPKLPRFEEPLDLTYAPGTDRLFVAGRWGKIWSFVNNKDADKADLALDLTEGDKKKVIYAFT